MRKRAAWLGLFLFLIVGFAAYDALRRAGELNTLTPLPLPCRAIPGVLGPEDITVDAARHVAYVSSVDWRAITKGGPAPVSGAIYRYAPGADTATVLYTRQSHDFHPHGIALWSDGQGPDLLYVVNHESATSHSLEVFELDEAGALHHLETWRDPSLLSPNDVVAVGRHELYVTNDHGQNRGLGQLIDDVLRRERAQILHVRNQQFRLLHDDLAYANGINASRDGRTIYVAEASGRRLREYTRAADSGELTWRRTVPLDMGPDNIELDAEGRLYIGGHPKLLTFLRHAANPQVLAPSEVVRISGERVEHLYLNLGEELGASTVAALLEGQLLIGSVFADHFLTCELAR